MPAMADDIDPLTAAMYAGGADAIDVAVDRITTLLEVRDEVLRSRTEDPDGFPGFGSTDGKVLARRVVGTLLDAGWRLPTREDVDGAANRSRERSERFTTWLDGLAPKQRARAIDYFTQHGAFPPDLRPPS